ncbi:MAG: alpha/beta hydrolase-fold protein, partial [Bacteroidota bacterium]|nr:alpha/beta hydrolase-fold protein [Bacteroidota bacterium]
EATGTVSPMIYVLPQGFNSYYVNKYDGSFDYMKMFVNELVPYIDKTYRTIADRDHRAVVGYSMGGFGAMVIPSMNPSVFSVSVPLSMSFRTDAQYTTEPADGWNKQWGSIFGGYGLLGEARLTAYYKSLCPLHFFTKASASSFSRMHYFLDCGDDEEQLSVGNDELHLLMRDLGIDHEYRVRNGAHTSAYWRSAMKEVLPFIESCFNSRTYKKEDTISVGSSYAATLEQKQTDGVQTTVFLPSGYNAAASASYPIVYLAHNGLDLSKEKEVMAMLDAVQQNAPFILVSFNQADMSGKSFKDWAVAVEQQYKTGGSSAMRIGLGAGMGGKLLFEASTNTDCFFKSVYLFDAAIDDVSMNPNPGTFYYIDITDQGTHCKGADLLYLTCRNQSISHEYRVRNGQDSYLSFLSGLQSIKTLLTSNLKH